MTQSNVGEFLTGSGVSQSESRTFVTYSENLIFSGYGTLIYDFSRYGDSINFLITTDIITVKVYDGTEFVEKPLKYWNGSSWEEPSEIKTWDGESWVVQ